MGALRLAAPPLRVCGPVFLARFEPVGIWHGNGLTGGDCVVLWSAVQSVSRDFPKRWKAEARIHRWYAQLDPVLWQKNIDYQRSGAQRWAGEG
jgi:hypothetical protein